MLFGIVNILFDASIVHDSGIGQLHANPHVAGLLFSMGCALEGR